MSPIPQKLIANYSIRGQAVPRAGDRSVVTGSSHGEIRSHSTYTVVHLGFSKGGVQPGIWGHSPQPQTNFFGFHKKTFILAHFFIEKWHAVSAITINNAKIFLQLMSKSRSLIG